MNASQLRRAVAVGILGMIVWGSAAARSQNSTTAPSTGPAIERRFLTQEDIQKIRRKELRPGDNVPVQIPQDVRKNYASKAGLSFEEFSAKPPVDQALDILANGDDSMKAQVRVQRDPLALVEFKKLQPMLLSGCAASQCHGGANGGNLVLFNENSDAAVYTNFYILTKYHKTLSSADGGNQGVFGGPAEHKMIDRGRGQNSILAQFGLPAAKANLPHPKLANFAPVFRDNEDPRFRKLVDWMNNTLKAYPPDQDYGIDYRIPKGKASSPAPATTQQSPPPTRSTGPATRPAAPRR